MEADDRSTVMTISWLSLVSTLQVRYTPQSTSSLSCYPKHVGKDISDEINWIMKTSPNVTSINTAESM